MKKIVIFVAMLAMLATTGCSKVTGADNGDIHVYTVDNTDGKITPAMIEAAFEKDGFEIGINSDIQGGLKKLFNEDGFVSYNAISMYHPKISLDLVKKHPDAGVFLPMGLAIFQKKGETDLKIAIVTAKMQAKMLKSDGSIVKVIEAKMAKTIMTLLPDAKHSYNAKSLDEKRVLITKYELDIGDADWEEAKEELEEKFEEEFEAAGFVMPSYFDLTEEFGEDSPYDFYSTYSICKIDVIKAVSKVKPEAAAFAPCTTMVYKKKDEQKIVMGFTSVYNWLSSAAITDKDSVKALMDAQASFETVLGKVTK